MARSALGCSMRRAELLPLFADYQNKTKREIPVLTLTRID